MMPITQFPESQGTESSLQLPSISVKPRSTDTQTKDAMWWYSAPPFQVCKAHDLMERKVPSSCTTVFLGNLQVSLGRSQGPKNHLTQDCVQASHEATSNGIRLKGTFYFESFKMISRHHDCRSRREKIIKLDEYMFVCL